MPTSSGSDRDPRRVRHGAGDRVPAQTRTSSRSKRLELEARRAAAAGDPTRRKQLIEENKLLRERVENLESIVCSVDFELNQKLAKLIDEQRSLVLRPRRAGADADRGADAPTAGRATDGDRALDRTATAHGAPARR